MSNAACAVVHLPDLRGLGNTAQMAQTQRPDPRGAADPPPHPQEKSLRGYAKVLAGTPLLGGASASPGSGLASVGLHHGVD